MINVRAPGSIMLFGEHAVLHGSHAIVAVIDQYLTVSVAWRHDKKITINSALGQYQTSLEDLQRVSPFEFVLAACDLYQQQLPAGVDIEIKSDFSHQLGLGSSAAVTVALCKAFRCLLEQTHSKDDVFKDAKKVMLAVQRIGSAADIAASTYGGVSLYRSAPFFVSPLSCSLDLSLAYCGYKEKTVNVLRKIEKDFADDQHTLEQVYAELSHCVELVKDKLSPNDAGMISEVCEKHQSCMRRLNLCTPELDQLITQYCSIPGVIAAKISGSGLGDCVVMLGTFPKEAFNSREDNIAIRISDEGVKLL